MTGTATAPLVGLTDLLRDTRHMTARAAPDLADWLVHLKVRRYSDRSIYTYHRTIARLLRQFPHKQFADFTDTDIEVWLLGSGGRSAHIDKSIANRWFDWGRRKRRIPENPVDPDVLRDVPAGRPVWPGAARLVPDPGCEAESAGAEAGGVTGVADTYTRIRPHCTTVPSINADRYAVGVVALIAQGRAARKPYEGNANEGAGTTLDGRSASTLEGGEV